MTYMLVINTNLSGKAMSPWVQQGKFAMSVTKRGWVLYPEAEYSTQVKTLPSLAIQSLPLLIVHSTLSFATGLVRAGKRQPEWGELQVWQISYVRVFFYFWHWPSDGKHTWCLFTKNVIFPVKDTLQLKFYKRQILPNVKLDTFSVKSWTLLLLNISMLRNMKG